VDANGLRFWLLADEQDWVREGDPPPEYDPERRSLRLGSFRTLGFSEAGATVAAQRLARLPLTVDSFDGYAFYDAGGRVIRGTGAAPGTAPLWPAPAGAEPTDLAAGADGVLYVAVGGAVVLRDLRDRWDPVTVSGDGFAAFRLATPAGGGALVLDRSNRRLARVAGQPFARQALRERSPTVFRPVLENPTPPALIPLPAAFATDEDPVALATLPDSAPAETVVLCWGAGGSASVRRLDEDGRLGRPVVLSGVARPFAVGWLDARTIAVLVATAAGSEVVTYSAAAAPGQTALQPLGGFYPLPGHDGGPFAHALSGPARYGLAPGADGVPARPRPLVRLSAPQRARAGSARNPGPLDGGSAGFVWHRLYLEADLPPGCGVRVLLGASERPDVAPATFHPHLFGDLPAEPGVPCAVWSGVPSELPFHPGVLPCPPVPHRAGLFSVLVQRAGRRVSALAGRYLWVRLELAGNGRQSPEVAALRLYGPRFSYLENYLPRIYREQLLPPEADDPAAGAGASRADFLERFLSNFEGVLTTLEDRVANAHLLTDPVSAPEQALDWLGRWLGFVFDPAYPPERRRRGLQAAMELHRRRGTVRGLELALDIVTGDACARGEIIVLEGWRLRRTFATILGADLADEDDPLLAGVVQSGNSIVGDSLILGDEFRREFTALFREVLPERPRTMSFDEWLLYIYQRYIDPAVVDAFFDRLAHRLTVLVHGETDDDRLGLITRVLQLEGPAHVEATVARASHPFIVGLASLVGVDTFLRKRPPPPPLRADHARIGAEGFLERPPSLDPRLEGGAG
jgi:phage tail-like protein